MQVSQKQSVDIEFRNLTYTTRGRNSRTILNGVNGQFKKGNLVGILGPSGAGKTTLLNILAGYINDSNVTGRINVNGKERDMRTFKKLSCYIMQEDVLQQQLTVEEITRLAADLKLGGTFTTLEKRKILKTVVEVIGLDRCLNTRTEHLSGGQLKRVAIALELINNPPVMFLDEPTTGLDNVVSKQCIELLKTLSEQGRTIVCTIHQPPDSILAYFDQLYIMSEGYCVYSGGVPEVVPFLDRLNLPCPKQHNPTEYIIELVHMRPGTTKILSAATNNGISPSKVINRKTMQTYRQTTYERIFSDKDARHGDDVDFPNSYPVQVAIISKRMYLQMSRNKLMLTVQLIHHIVSSLSLGLSFFAVGDDASKAIANYKFMIAIVVFYCYTYLMVPILTFPFELELVRREYFNRWYSLKAYYTALTFSNVPQLVLFGVLFNVIVYTLADQPLEADRFFQFNVICILMALNSAGLGVTIGAIFGAIAGTCVGSAYGMYLILMCLYGIGYGDQITTFMQILMNTAFPRLGVIGFSVALLRERPLFRCGDEHIFCFVRDPDELLQLMGMRDAKMGFVVAGLLATLIVHRVAAYVALKVKLSRHSLRPCKCIR